MHTPVSKRKDVAAPHFSEIPLAITLKHLAEVVFGQLLVRAKDLDAVQALDFFKAVDSGVGWQLALQGVHVSIGLQAHKGGQHAAGNSAAGLPWS